MCAFLVVVVCYLLTHALKKLVFAADCHSIMDRSASWEPLFIEMALGEHDVYRPSQAAEAIAVRIKALTDLLRNIPTKKAQLAFFDGVMVRKYALKILI